MTGRDRLPRPGRDATSALCRASPPTRPPTSGPQAGRGLDLPPLRHGLGRRGVPRLSLDCRRDGRWCGAAGGRHAGPRLRVRDPSPWGGRAARVVDGTRGRGGPGTASLGRGEGAQSGRSRDDCRQISENDKSRDAPTNKVRVDG